MKWRRSHIIALVIRAGLWIALWWLVGVLWWLFIRGRV